MDKDTFSWGWVIFIVLILWFFVGGSAFGRRGCGYDGVYGCDVVSNCQVERQGLITAAETNYRIIEENQKSTNTISAQLRAQWDANQAEKIFDLKINNLAQQNAFNLALMEKNSTIERMTLANTLNQRFNQIDATLASLDCHVLKRPELVGIAAACTNAAVINGLGFNGFNNCGYNSCCNGLV